MTRATWGAAERGWTFSDRRIATRRAKPSRTLRTSVDRLAIDCKRAESNVRAKWREAIGAIQWPRYLARPAGL